MYLMLINAAEMGNVSFLNEWHFLINSAEDGVFRPKVKMGLLVEYDAPDPQLVTLGKDHLTAGFAVELFLLDMAHSDLLHGFNIR